MKWLSAALLHLIGAALAAGIVALLMGFVFGTEALGLGWAFFLYAYFFAVLIGVPGYFVLRRFDRANWFTVAALGFGVGLVVVGLFGFWDARIVKIERLYAVPWLAKLANSAVFALIGSAGALAFWFLINWRGAAAQEVTTRQRHIIGAVAVTLLAAFIYLQAGITRDRSCHSQDYGSGPPNLTSLRVQIGPDDWPALERLLQIFGRQNGLSSRLELWRPPQRWDQEFSISLCRDGLGNIYGGDGTGGVYIHFKGSDQRALRRLYLDLYPRITAIWPERTSFVWEGEPAARPVWLPSPAKVP